MARATPGPLISSAHGSIGGTTLRDGRNGLIISRRASRRGSTSPNVIAYRSLLARATAAWTALGASVKAQWETMSPGYLTGRSAYIHAWLIQNGATTITAPTPPTSQTPPGPAEPQFTVYDGQLYVIGFNRDIGADEQFLSRIHAPRSAWQRTNNRAILRTIAAGPTSGLGETPAYGLQLDNPGGYCHTSITGTSAGNWTVELWFKPDVLPTGAERQYLFFIPTYLYCYLYDGPTLALFRSGAGAFLNAPDTTRQWNYLAIVGNLPAARPTVYLNNEVLQTPPTLIAPDINAALYIATDATDANQLDSPIAEVRISDTRRSAAEIEATWNGGAGAAYTIDAHTLNYWPLRTVTGGISPDLGSTPHNATVAGYTLRPGPFAQVATTADEIRRATPVTTRSDTRVIYAPAPWGNATRTDHTWT